MLEAELGGPVDEVFAEFDWEPLAAASIGQTYRARLRTGEAVVVKIQRPGIDDVIERDLAALALLANVAQRRTDVRPGSPLGRDARAVRRQPPGRARLPPRGRRMVEMTLLLGPDSRVRVPACHTEFCTRRLLVQERFDGFTVADIAELDAAGIDRNGARRASCCASTLEQVLRIGFFHADPHPGNIFVFRDGTLGLIDFGAVGRLDPIQQAAVVDILAAMMRRDVGLLRDGIERVAEVQNPTDPRSSSGRWRGCWPTTSASPAPSNRRCCRTSSPRWRVSASACPPISSCSRARWSPSTARSASSRPTSRSCPPRPSR